MVCRSCGFCDKDRRPVDPPPIVELSINGSTLNQDEIQERLRGPHYVVTCTIYDELAKNDASLLLGYDGTRRRLIGSLVATSFYGVDEHGSQGCFFCFSDLSCRSKGLFRLHFSVIRVDAVSKRLPVLAEVVSDVFKVCSAEDFPGMQASTALARCLRAQGCIITIRKGKSKGEASTSSDESDLECGTAQD